MMLKGQKPLSGILLGSAFMVLVTSLHSVSADSNDNGRYNLPSSKVDIPICEKEALDLHPGTIKEINELHQKGATLFQIKITAREGSESSVLCDAETGKIIRTEYE